MARNIVGEIFLNTRAIDGGVGADVQTIINKAQNIAASKVPVSADTREAEANVARLQGQIQDGIGGAWQAAAIEAAAFTASVLGIRAAIEGAINKLSGLFDQLAQAQAGFSAILGSEAAGGRLLDDIREFARVSPFVTQQLVNYSQQLLGVGQSAESIVPLLKNTGDLIASVGGDTQNISRVLFTLTQIRSIGRLVGQDAIQLQSALVPITKLLADFLGKTTAEIKKMQEQGSISADTVFAAIQNAGQKVEGAMATATRNISGARSVLQDTITIMAQDSQVLNLVFDDIVKGILDFSAALGENEKLKSDIAAIDEALTSLYTNLKPLFEGFSDASAQIALSSLDILATTLTVLAGAINAVPPAALKAIGQALALFVALRAPIALLNYVSSLQRLSGVLRFRYAAEINQTTAAMREQGVVADQTAGSLTRLSTRMGKTITAASSLALAAGLVTSTLGEGNDTAEAFGSALSTGALGAQIGAQFGVHGAVIGAFAGAGLGAITSFVTNAREESERRQAEIAEIGSKAAKKFLDAFSLTTPDIDTTADFTKFFADTEHLREAISLHEDLVEQQKAVALAASKIDMDPTHADEAELAVGNTLINKIAELDDQIAKTGKTAEAAKAELASLLSEGEFFDAATKLSTILIGLNKDSESYQGIVREIVSTKWPKESMFDFSEGAERAHATAILLGDEIAQTPEDFELLAEIAASTGLTIETLFIIPLEDAIAILDKKLPSALTQSRLHVLELQTAFEESKKVIEEFFKPFVQQINNAQAAITASAGLSKATEVFIDEQSTTNALAYAEALLKVGEIVGTTSNLIKPGSGHDAAAAAVTAQLDLLRESMGWTDDQFQTFLRDAQLLSVYGTQATDAFEGNLTDLSRITGLTKSRLQELIPPLREVGDAEIVIPVDVIDALRNVDNLTSALGEIPGLGPDIQQALKEALEQDFTSAAIIQIKNLEKEAQEVIRQLRFIPGSTANIEANQAKIEAQQVQSKNRRDYLADLQAQEDARLAAEEAERLAKLAAEEAERLAKQAAEEAKREAERQAREAERLAEEQQRELERLQQALKDAGETIQNAMEQASEAIVQAAQSWTTSIRERQQDEPGVPIARLLRNASQQAANLGELNEGILALEGRGLSQSAQQAIGIDSVTDIRQVRRLLASSSGDLAELSRLIGLRDTNAEIIARRQQQQETQATIVAAIVQAASILGYEITPEAAQALALQVNITGNPESAILPAGIIGQLQDAGLLLRR